MAPRSLSGPVGLPGDGRSGTARRRAADQADAEPLHRLAARWARLAPGDDPRVVGCLAGVLGRLAAMVGTEPFWPFAARSLGAELAGGGLCGPPEPGRRRVEHAERIAGSSRRLLRNGAAALGVVGPAAERRLAVAVDEMMAGLIDGLQRRDRSDEDDPGVAHDPRRDSSTYIALAPRLSSAASGEAGADPADVEPMLRSITDRGLRAAYEQTAVGCGVAELDGVLVDLNPALARMFGLTDELAEPRPLSDFVHPDDLADLVDRLQRLMREESEVLRIELRLLRYDGGAFWAHVTASRVLDGAGRPSYLLIVVEDVSERHRLRSRLEEATYQDQLTRLPNRTVAEQWLHRAVGSRGPGRVGVCTLDLDGFHLVNEAHGQQVGDRLLLAVAGRLQVAATEHLVTRTGSDEFTVLVADPDGVGEVARLADRLLSTIAMPFTINGVTISVTTSIGVAEGDTHQTCAEEFLRSSDVARMWAKKLGGGRAVVFDPERDAAESARFALLSGMRGAIGRGEFRLVFQPLVRLSDRRLRGAEALVRWQHPEQGLLSPARFIQLAEYSGAIVPLGRWILEAACERAAGWWRELGPQAPYVSVNVSPVQLAEPGWLGDVKEVLESTGLPAEQLQLEITEQAVLGEDAAPLDALASLRAAGVRLALDDFGTGYSSLAWLRRLPVHALKIDGSFIEGLRNPDPDPTDSSIVRALIGMAHALGLEVTAEWVQTGVQAERLIELGCDYGQGEHFGEAGPGEWVPELYRRSIGG
ncbi:putative bifunctional diguanylate cyclase/phosphodiesterase [Pseudonocardia humida]|uniref:EAL domain-containing protein n=1 Tax=Pseudonocardia humida TaxID=2800819 RepID=A0ABT1A8B2_9PSEU|nr:GGDEF domain-containing phosphodiesterase [Pseudonocardia humida]MCO1659265.1 EAL domain-containing protein [Pseudonocardia humida]